MFSSVLKFIIFLVLLRLFLPFIKRFAGVSSKKSGAGDNERLNKRHAQGDYSDLTSYEIEDADFEEIREEKGVKH